MHTPRARTLCNLHVASAISLQAIDLPTGRATKAELGKQEISSTPKT